MLNRLPRELSGGQQQRLALAKTLAEDPTLLLIDEPFSNLDPIVKRELIFALREIIRTEEVSLIMVTHDTTDALMHVGQDWLFVAWQIVKIR